jgi:MarR family transcriptional regulator, organic hydroperoxide resistance regulator
MCTLKLNNQLCFALYTATNSITRMYSKLLSGLNLTYPQYLVLLVLCEAEGLSVTQVKNKLKMDTGTLSPIIKRLEKSDFVIKKRIDTDERIVRLFLTEQAKQIQPAVAEIQYKVACNTGLAADDFFELLDRLNQLAKSLALKEARESVAS